MQTENATAETLMLTGSGRLWHLWRYFWASIWQKYRRPRMQSIILLLLINQTKARMRRHKRHKRPMPYAVRLSAVAFELR